MTGLETTDYLERLADLDDALEATRAMIERCCQSIERWLILAETGQISKAGALKAVSEDIRVLRLTLGDT